MFYSKSLLAVVILTVLFNCSVLQSQSSQPALSLDKSPVEGQFQYVYKRSNDFEEFKMVKRWHFARLKSHVLDTLNNLKQDLISSSIVIDNKNTAIDSLITANEAVQAKLNTAIAEKESLSVFGVMTSKAAYNSILWSVIAILAGGFVLGFLLFKRSNTLTFSTKNDLADMKMQFEAFRKRALEREEGIVRKYHNELNKYKTKSGKLS